MFKEKKNIIISAVILLIIGGLIFFFLSSNNAGNIATSTSQVVNPFGNTSGNRNFGSSTQIQQTGQDIINETGNVNKLTSIYKKPTSGSVFFINKNNQNVLRFVDRAVGNIYEYLPEKKTGEAQRLTNTTIPKIQETVWSNSGNDLVLRYLDNDTDNINSFSAKIKVASSSIDSIGEMTGLFLSSNLKQLAINPKGDRIFALVNKSDRSGTYGFISNLDGSGKKTVFDSPMSYWNISWPKDGLITLTTKPNYASPGILYFFNTQTYSLDRILGNIIGMSTITNKDTSLVAYSYSINNSFYLDIYNVINKISSDLKIPTLADKCVWGNSNSKILYCAIPKNIPADNYPDSWYLGLVSFNDDIWRINTETGAIEQIYNIGLSENVEIDAFDLKISSDDKYLAFSNKKDLSLWVLEIKE